MSRIKGWHVSKDGSKGEYLWVNTALRDYRNGKKHVGQRREVSVMPFYPDASISPLDDGWQVMAINFDGTDPDKSLRSKVRITKKEALETARRHMRNHK